MTDLPPLDPTDPYGQATYVPQYAAAPPARPGSISVMSILAVVFGSLGLMCGLVRVVAQFITLAMGGRNPFAPNVPAMNDVAISAYGAVSNLFMLALTAVLLVGGIGGLKLRPWARRLMVRWSIVAIAWATISLVVALAWVIPVTGDFVRRTQPQAANAIGSMFVPLQVVFAFVGWVLNCTLPVCFLLLWRSPKVIAAFEQPEAQRFQP